MNRLIIEAVAALALIGAFFAYRAHEQSIGVAKCEAADAVAVQKQEVVNAEKHGEQVAEVKTEAEEFHEQTSQPVRNAPVVRVCVAPQRRRAAPEDRAPGPVDHGQAELRTADTPVPTAIDWDSEPVVRAGRDADAQVRALQSYITDVCQK